MTPASLPAGCYAHRAMPQLPEIPVAHPAAERFGFRYGSKGTHTSRTLMLEELALLLAAIPATASRDDYVHAITEGNVTEKRTVATRRHTVQRLSELYALDLRVPLFKVLRRLWGGDETGRPLLALLCGLARDPLLRLTLPVIVALPIGSELSRQEMVRTVRNGTIDRLNTDSIDKVVRNASSSWTQSGHLSGRMRKLRQRVAPTPAVTAFALLLGYLEGVRGAALLRTSWARLLDNPPESLIQSAKDAKRLGLLDLRHAGDVVEFGFTPLLTIEKLKESHGTH